MNSELEILKKIWEAEGETYIRLISNQTGFGIDYTRYICNCLFKKGQITPVKENRDWYRITSKGKRELKTAGIIKPKVPTSCVSKVERVIYYFPRKLKLRRSKKASFLLPPSPLLGRSKSDSREARLKKTRGSLEAEEKKFNLGKTIEKAISYLRNL